MFNKEVYKYALNLLYWNDDDLDDSWDDFVEKYNINPYDLILNLILEKFENLNELEKKQNE